jgi:hypothetical protein
VDRWHVRWCAPRTDGAGIAVAILDGRVCAHPDVPMVPADDRRVFLTGPDTGGHGTAAAGLVHAVAPACRLILGQVLTPGGGGSEDALTAGLEWALSRGARVVVLGVGRPRAWGAPWDATWESRAAAADAVILAPAGNGSRPDRPEAVRDPAACPSILSVGAIDPHGRPLATNAVADPVKQVDLLVPGADVPAPYPDGRTTLHTGTSTAAAVAAGWAATILAEDPAMTPETLRRRLRERAALHCAQGGGCRTPGSGGTSGGS